MKPALALVAALGLISTNGLMAENKPASEKTENPKLDQRVEQLVQEKLEKILSENEGMAQAKVDENNSLASFNRSLQRIESRSDFR